MYVPCALLGELEEVEAAENIELEAGSMGRRNPGGGVLRGAGWRAG